MVLFLSLSNNTWSLDQNLFIDNIFYGWISDLLITITHVGVTLCMTFPCATFSYYESKNVLQLNGCRAQQKLILNSLHMLSIVCPRCFQSLWIVPSVFFNVYFHITRKRYYYVIYIRFSTDMGYILDLSTYP
jgi:hypothetical protein